MQASSVPSLVEPTKHSVVPIVENQFSYKVIRRNGDLSSFDPIKIKVAISKAFLAVEGESAGQSARIHDISDQLSKQIVTALTRHGQNERVFHIEEVQDQVELALMRGGHHKIARAYVLYREQHAQAREVARLKAESETDAAQVIATPTLKMTMSDGQIQILPIDRLEKVINEACADLSGVDSQKVITETKRNLYDGIREAELYHAPILAARSMIEYDPAYSQVCARLLLDKLRMEVLTFIYGINTNATQGEMAEQYGDYFKQYIKTAVTAELLDPELEKFDLDKITAALLPERDLQFQYLGLQTLYDRYFLHIEDNRIELPQAFFMRVAMGLALREIDREEKAIEFYRLLSSFDFMSSTPTLFNSGTRRSQLSSCYLTTVADDLEGIYKSFKDNALLAKYSGGLGNDWTRVRGMGAYIKGTNGKSQGLIPFLKVANDTAVAVNQGGKRKGAVCAYLETWHIDVEEFLDLRKNTGDERRRTHDMNTANWIPDLFMERVYNDEQWTLFSPNDAIELHECYGEAFKTIYEEYEDKAQRGEIKLFKKVRALDLWRKMLTMLFETGHPWMTFKDPCNIRSPQSHAGVVHSSNLCTEITLNTSDQETAVCNLGSINLVAHLEDNNGVISINQQKLERTINTAMRMLDNVIDINFYNIPEARRSNLKHRPVGMGIMGFQDALFNLKIPYGSKAAVDFADHSMEIISYHAIQASTNLAEERGSYPSFNGSLWSQGILPIDSVKLLEQARTKLRLPEVAAASMLAGMDKSMQLDWTALRERVKRVGMRNSNTMAIAPTATISNICGVSQSIEPVYQNLFVKSNLSGDFTVVNRIMVEHLKSLGIWDEVMILDLKYYDGSLQQIERIPQAIKELYATAFEIDSSWLIEAASRRQKWIDQGQSLNLYIAQANGKKLDELYRLAWERGLKTTYYLRSSSASHVEKSTLTRTDGKLNAVSSIQPQACSIDDPDCEACQ